MPKHIVITSEYINAHALATFKCTLDECGHVWEGTTNDLLYKKQGCEQCRIRAEMLARNQKLDRLLAPLLIKRLDDCFSLDHKIHFLCLVDDCGYGANREWATSPHSILWSGTGCPKCYGNVKLTLNEVDERLFKQRVARLGEYVNSGVPMHCKCLECDYEWYPLPDNLFHGHGCTQCSGILPLTNHDVDARLIGRKVKRLDDYVSMSTMMSWLCLEEGCGFQWQSAARNVVGSKGSNCPKCGGSLPLTNADVDARLKPLNIQRIGNYTNNRTPIEFECMNSDCHYRWVASPGRITRGETGCPQCNIGKSQRSVLKALEAAGISFESEKYLADIDDIDSLYHVDFYLRQYNAIIEYNGRQHYEPTCFGNIPLEEAIFAFTNYQQPRDAFVKQFCVERGIELIVIDGRQYYGDEVSEYVASNVIPMLRKSNERKSESNL